jgi:DNA-binding CsgD family transcriptional regulator
MEPGLGGGILLGRSLSACERESAGIVEDALAGAAGVFRDRLIERLDRLIGFAKASLHESHGGREVTLTRGYEDPRAFEALPRYMAEYDSREIGAVSSGRPMVDVDLLPAGRRDRLSSYREVLRPERVSVYVTAIWPSRAGALGFSLARTERGGRFRQGELRTLERVLPAIRIGAAYVSTLAPPQEAESGPSLEAWADEVGLTGQERRVAALVTRGLTNPEVGRILGLSPHTVRNQLVRVFRKADVTTRAELVFVSAGGSATGRPSALRGEAASPPWLLAVRPR